jgi:hypothetical protein
MVNSTMNRFCRSMDVEGYIALHKGVSILGVDEQ